LAEYPDNQAPVPYGPENAHQDLSLLVEEGFRPVRGLLTEGRFLTFEDLGLALTNLNGKTVGVSLATASHSGIRQRWILHATGSPNTFYIQSAVDKTYISTKLGSLTPNVKDAQTLTISYTPDGATYSFSIGEKGSSFVSLSSGQSSSAASRVSWGIGDIGQFKVYSVSYQS
jgi:phospholipase C